ncbi:S-adenosylmethionine:tRNA ribosyltransferase-isomerase [Chitinophagaceae bacterium LB-8]|uniref:S-adenosylmethionine:tRNA ribosyltransferase-isomerase n=1 Tax=Paraflavisolibacter caeni TaxID=2982496 RepID=A0A9X2XT04_9BACT|nr:S-adenosylmethionine:tRNA ribosyltransferase-isomerase [Paraflavisolibacter caeni]MCU7547742.1 S-adenosylmethionine:tRNA ribosyltransferase-isomerase [Paraflavisolibacter caeni]
MKVTAHEIFIKDYTYSLPQERIAAFPLPERDQSKLLVYKSGKISDDVFYNTPEYLEPGATFILNNTRVIEARILFHKPTGGVIEIFCLEPTDENNIENAICHTGPVRWNCLIGGASKWKPGQVLQKQLLINDREVVLSAHYIDKLVDSFVIEFSWQPSDVSFGEVVHAAGAIPLPPYIKREALADDANRYQTIFARYQGSVAAPTAALHFTDTVFNKLSEKDIHPSYITLHVGAGTFKPVKSETIADHTMHAEHFHVSLSTLEKLAASQAIVAVGTTSLRTLESLYWIGIKVKRLQYIEAEELVLEQWEAYELEEDNISYIDSIRAILDYMKQHNMGEVFCRTSLIIVPGYTFRSAKALITNFHQPQSTLLLLVAAFIGDEWKKVYQHALENDYRFLSYGDSSLLIP